MTTHPWKYDTAGAGVFGAGAIDALGDQRPVKKASKVALLSDAGVRAAGITERAERALGGKVALLVEDIVPDADVAHIDATAARAKEAGVDTIVAVGGGSVIDSAKCVAAVLTKGGSIADYEGFATIRSRLTPIVAVPTTAGTGAEVSQFAVVAHRAEGRKLILSDRSLVPALGVLDPEVVKGLPPEHTAATGVDALTHAIEAMASRMRNPVGSALALEAAQMIVGGALERSLAEPDDLDARGAMLTAANLSGVAISMNMLGAVHAFAHALGAAKGVPHGVANGIFLAPVMRMNLEKARGAYTRLGAALGGSGDDTKLAGYAIAEIERVVHKVAGIPEKLSEVDVTEADLDPLAELVMADPDLSTNPVQIHDKARVLEILRARL
jgi:alcohol dehydrogenase